MPIVKIRYRDRSADWVTESFVPETFGEAVPDLAAGLPAHWIAVDYSYEWEGDGTLVVFETSYKIREYGDIDSGIPLELRRSLDPPEERREFGPAVSPEVWDEVTQRYGGFRST